MLIAPASQEQKSWTVAISIGAVCSLFSIGIVALSLYNSVHTVQPVDTSSTMWAYFEISGGMAVRIRNESGEINNLCALCVCCDDF